MRIPFFHDFDPAFRSNSPLRLKVGGCAMVAVFVAMISYVWETHREGSTFKLSPLQLCAYLAAWAALGSVGGLLLVYKDVVDRRLACGGRVNSILAFYSRGGILCVLGWFVTIIVVAFVLIFVVAFLAGMFKLI